MNSIRFTSPEDMLNTILNARDLYSREIEQYVFAYTDNGSICIYRGIALAEAEFREHLSEIEGEYWGAHLGWRNSSILDSPEWYKKHQIKMPDNYYGPMEYCKEFWQKEWCTCGPRFQNTDTKVM